MISPIQYTIDAMALQAIPLLFVLIFQTKYQFGIIDYVLGYCSTLLSITGNIAFTIAMQSGKGGPIQAIDSMKSIVNLGFNMMLTRLMPTTL